MHSLDGVTQSTSDGEFRLCNSGAVTQIGSGCDLVILSLADICRGLSILCVAFATEKRGTPPDHKNVDVVEAPRLNVWIGPDGTAFGTRQPSLMGGANQFR